MTRRCKSLYHINTGRILKSFTDKVKGNQHSLFHILSIWESIAGEHLSRMSYPSRLRKIAHKNGTTTPPIYALTLVVKSSALLEMRYQSDTILERLRLYYGRQVIQKLSFVATQSEKSTQAPQERSASATPKPWPNATEGLEKIRNADLRHILTRLKNH